MPPAPRRGWDTERGRDSGLWAGERPELGRTVRQQFPTPKRTNPTAPIIAGGPWHEITFGTDSGTNGGSLTVPYSTSFPASFVIVQIVVSWTLDDYIDPMTSDEWEGGNLMLYTDDDADTNFVSPRANIGRLSVIRQGGSLGAPGGPSASLLLSNADPYVEVSWTATATGWRNGDAS